MDEAAPQARAIHVDAATGSDAGPGTAEAPLRSLARAAGAIGVGGTLRLKAGSVFRETLRIGHPGVTVEGYGHGAMPRISGGQAVPAGQGLWLRLPSALPKPLDRFGGGAAGNLWSSVPGLAAGPARRAGSSSWRFAPSVEDQQARRTMEDTFAEITGWLRVDPARQPEEGSRTRLAGFEGRAWHAADGVFMWLEWKAGAYRLGLGRGLSVVAGTVIGAGDWQRFRLSLRCSARERPGRAALFLGDAAAPAHVMDGLVLETPVSMAGFGLYGFDPARFAVSFDDVALWQAPSDGGPPVWSVEGIGTEPLVVTLDGQPGRRCLSRAELADPGDFHWNPARQRLELCAAGVPDRIWAEIEYSARTHPVRIEAAWATLRGIAVSHHNLDDGSGGLLAGQGMATLSRARLVLLREADRGREYVSRPGRSDSLWNRRLDGRGSYAPLPQGFGALPMVLGGWLTPPITTAVHRAALDDPWVDVLYHPDVWNQVSAGAWARAGNPPQTERAILAGAMPDFPSRSGAAWGRYVYQTARASGWWLPEPPAFEPAAPAAPGTARRVRCPAGVEPPPDTDGYLSIFQPDGTVFEAYCPVVTSDRRIVCFSYGITRSDGLLEGREGGTCASLLPNHAGVIRDGELSAGQIPHAMALYLPEAHLAPAARRPALSWDWTNRYRGTIPMGARLAIPPAVELDPSPLSSMAGRVIARAAKDYGFMAVDRNGGHGVIVKTQHNAPRDHGWLNQPDDDLRRDLSWVLAHLRMVT